MINFLQRVTEPLEKADPPAPCSKKGFFTDATLCIGCKACEVACKQWNQLPYDNYGWTGHSYDNTTALSAKTWRHVLFVEKPRINGLSPSWLMVSDVCKHCGNAPCHEACPTGAIVRTEFDTVVVQNDVCNGCGYCVAACPFGVLTRAPEDGGAHKCTLCYDRLKDDLVPACAKHCPTESIKFGDLDELRETAKARVAELHARGNTEAYLYGADSEMLGAGLNSFFLLTERPEVYNLPAEPKRPVRNNRPGYFAAAVMAAGLAIAGAVVFGRTGGKE